MENNKPCLLIIIGLPGSGKDTVVKNLKNKNPNSIVLSSDDIRKELFGFEDQTQNALVFQTMNQRCKAYLQSNNDVIYNATNLNRKKRMALINEMKKYASIKSLICLCSIGTIFERNLRRPERHIPEEKILQMIRNTDVPLYYEGYEQIYYVNTDFYINNVEFDKELLTTGFNYNQNNPYHNETLLEHLYTVEEQVSKMCPNDDILINASFMHDWGKPYCREFNEEKGYCTYYNHHKVSAYLAMLYESYGVRYAYKGKIHPISQDVVDIATLIYHHMDKFNGNLEKTKKLIGDELYKKLEMLMEADSYRKDK